MRIIRRLWMFLGLVWRYDMTGYRMSASTAWEIARITYSRTVSYGEIGEEEAEELRRRALEVLKPLKDEAE